MKSITVGCMEAGMEGYGCRRNMIETGVSGLIK